jgi:hypothetical protein
MYSFLVCYGNEVVEFHKGSMTKEDATLEANKLIGQGYTNVRVRAEDPHHPSWPLNFDNEEKA